MLQSHTHTRTYLHARNSRACSLAKPTSLNPPCTSPSVSALCGLGCMQLGYWMELSGKCPTIGCCQLVKFFCYHGCRVSCPNVPECILWCWWNRWHSRCYAEKKSPFWWKSGLHPNHSLRMLVDEPRMAPLYIQHKREDEIYRLWSRWNTCRMKGGLLSRRYTYKGRNRIINLRWKMSIHTRFSAKWSYFSCLYPANTRGMWKIAWNIKLYKKEHSTFSWRKKVEYIPRIGWESKPFQLLAKSLVVSWFSASYILTIWLQIKSVISLQGRTSIISIIKTCTIYVGHICRTGSFLRYDRNCNIKVVVEVYTRNAAEGQNL